MSFQKRSLVCLVLLKLLSVVAFADEPHFNPKAEQYIQSQILGGEDINVGEKFDEPVIRAEFLASLMKTSADLLKSRGLQISGATVVGNFDLYDQEIPYSVSLEACEFLGEVNFSGTHFKRDLTLTWSKFTDALMLVDADVAGDLSLEIATVAGNVDLANARVGGELNLRGTEFANRASFELVEVGGGVTAKGTSFLSPIREVHFDRIKVVGDVLLTQAVFSGPVDFSFVSVNGNFDASEARFTNVQVDSAVTFQGIKIEGNGWFKRTVFNCWVDFRGGVFGRNFEAMQATFNAPWQKANFGLKADVIDFRQAKFTAGYIVDGLQYRELHADSIDSFLAQADYSAGAYGQAEEFLRREGKGGAADNLYIAQRRRERRSLSGPEKVGNFMLDILVGYGRRPWLAFVWALGFVALGAAIFWKRSDMQPQKPEYENRPYSPFWYSLDQFLPFVDLKSADYFEPRTNRSFARLYLRIHILLGWILIPVGLAAISGLVK